MEIRPNLIKLSTRVTIFYSWFVNTDIGFESRLGLSQAFLNRSSDFIFFVVLLSNILRWTYLLVVASEVGRLSVWGQDDWNLWIWSGDTTTDAGICVGVCIKVRINNIKVISSLKFFNSVQLWFSRINMWKSIGMHLWRIVCLHLHSIYLIVYNSLLNLWLKW